MLKYAEKVIKYSFSSLSETDFADTFDVRSNIPNKRVAFNFRIGHGFTSFCCFKIECLHLLKLGHHELRDDFFKFSLPDNFAVMNKLELSRYEPM